MVTSRSRTPAPGGGCVPPGAPHTTWTGSPLTKLLASVTYWLYGDDVMRMADAARMVYGDRPGPARGPVRRLIERGVLGHY